MHAAPVVVRGDDGAMDEGSGPVDPAVVERARSAAADAATAAGGAGHGRSNPSGDPGASHTDGDHRQGNHGEGSHADGPAAPAGTADRDAPALAATPADTSTRRSLRPRLPAPVRRITRVQAVALVLFTMLTLGPIVALVIILESDPSTHPELATDGAPAAPATSGVLLQLTITNVNAVSGEMSTRIRVVPDATLLLPGGGLKNELTIASNDVQGHSVVVVPANQAPGPTAIVTALSSGSISRYPFDRYEAGLQIIVSQSVNGKQQEVPTAVSIEGGVSDMAISADLEPDAQSLLGRVATLQIRRSAPTLVFTTWMMCLWWALSISAVFTVWSVAIWRSTVPQWAYGFFVGVLFALTPLRGALPGSPPYGVLVDYVSFYWAIVIVGVGLMMLVAYFIRDARGQSRQLRRAEAERAAEAAETERLAHLHDVAVQTRRTAAPRDG